MIGMAQQTHAHEYESDSDSLKDPDELESLIGLEAEDELADKTIISSQKPSWVEKVKEKQELEA